MRVAKYQKASTEYVPYIKYCTRIWVTVVLLPIQIRWIVTFGFQDIQIKWFANLSIAVGSLPESDACSETTIETPEQCVKYVQS